ncbi:DeoR/GlpR family DNA-binding transcription regulator [Fodinicurvata halophila]|uniref:hypothetical protein n=1 Tax=Fodinicurvata halophila TaxID=1419723 RepID=UPI00363A2E66
MRSSVRVKEKRAIAACAARLVESGQTLFLDAGSTTSILSERLSGLSGLTVITNSLNVASNMTEREEQRSWATGPCSLAANSIQIRQRPSVM